MQTHPFDILSLENGAQLILPRAQARKTLL